MKQNAITKDYFGVQAEDQSKVKYASDLISLSGTLILFDAESSDNWELTKEKLMAGIVQHCNVRNITPNDLLEDYDADTADAIVQYALFNELTFG
jgi:hypothetical protein